MPEEIINKLLAESPLAAALIICAYMLRPVLKVYLDQQLAQLTRIGDLVAQLNQRMDRIEAKVDGIAEEQQHVAA